jgi:outer membrane protein assembly factor BamB
MNQGVVSFAGFILLATFSAHADNWPHWRGESGNGVSTTARPPTNWSATKNVKWKVAVPGLGSSTPVVWEDQVFVTSAVGAGNGKPLQFTLFCFNRTKGDIRWKKTAVSAVPHQGTHATNGYASASPCTDGKHVYAHFGSRGLYCYTMDGTLKWKRDDFPQMNTRNSFGEGSSPTLEGDMILVPWDHEGASFLYALNKFTGKEIWKTPRESATCWSTPLVVEHDGKKQVVMNGQRVARAYDLETGKEIWHCSGQTERPAASPVATDGIVYVGSGFRGAYLGAFRLDGRGDIKGTKSVAWEIDRDTPDVGSLLLSSGRIYFYKDKVGVLTCVDATTGKSHFGPVRVPGLQAIYASPVAAGGHVYLTDRNGTTVVIKDAAQFEVVASNSVGETVDATPVPVDRELFIRGVKHLFCIAE